MNLTPDHNKPSLPVAYNLVENLDQDALTINKDKLHREIKEFIEAREYVGTYIGFAGVFITVLLTIVTANFKEALGLNPDVWKAIFVITASLCFVYLIIRLPKVLRAPNVEKLVDRLFKKPQL